MSAVGKDFANLTHYISNLHGGSQPILAQASDGRLYVVKFTNNLQGANLSFNESMGSELYRACKLAVPAWKPLMVTDAFLQQNPGCWMQGPEGRLRPDAGLCFGSGFLGGEGIRLLEILPGTAFRRIRNRKSFWLAWMIDICAEHADNRQAVFQEDAERQLNAFFVDNGHLFGGPKGEQRPHFQASSYLDSRIYLSLSSGEILDLQRIVGSLDVDQLWKKMRELPHDWKTASALTNFEECLNRLSNADLLRNILDTIDDAVQRANEFVCCESQNERKARGEVLRPGVQNPAIEQFVHTSFGSHYACA
jgi:hypothetical protein